MFLAALDQTIVAPALPTIGAALGNPEFLSWVISAYLLTSTATTPLYGKVSDIYGRRPTLYTAMAIFLVGSIGCALSPSMARSGRRARLSGPRRRRPDRHGANGDRGRRDAA